MGLAPKQLRPATKADLDDLPATWRGEILDGELYAFPRPRGPHADIETSIGADLESPFQRGRGGPDDQRVRAEPFETVELDLAPWWEALDDEE